MHDVHMMNSPQMPKPDEEDLRLARYALQSPSVLLRYDDLSVLSVPQKDIDTLSGIFASVRAKERERCVGIVTALWGADLITTQAVMSGTLSLDEAMTDTSKNLYDEDVS